MKKIFSFICDLCNLWNQTEPFEIQHLGTGLKTHFNLFFLFFFSYKNGLVDRLIYVVHGKQWGLISFPDTICQTCKHVHVNSHTYLDIFSISNMLMTWLGCCDTMSLIYEYSQNLIYCLLASAKPTGSLSTCL